MGVSVSDVVSLGPQSKHTDLGLGRRMRIVIEVGMR